MNTAGRVNAGSVSKTLKAAGHCKSEKHTTRIKGYYDFTAGFVSSQAGNTVQVYWRHSTSDTRSPDLLWIARQGAARSLAKTLEAKGYIVEIAGIDSAVLYVSKQDPQTFSNPC